MQLPLRYQSEPGSEPVLSVDGAFGAPGRTLSHWPGNHTPSELKHALSTGIACNFVRLSADDQAHFLKGLCAVVNNHFDTDGLMALFALYHPDLALVHSERLIEWASAGDFFWVPSQEAFAVDQLVQLYVDPLQSPLPEVRAASSTEERYRLTTLGLFARIPGWLEHGLGAETERVARAVERLQSDQAQLNATHGVPLVHLDLMVWTLPLGHAPLPGRHALFQAAQSDRVLVLAPTAQGTRVRFLISTLSWFDLPERKALPRPDLARLVDRLNSLEGLKETAEHAWRAQSTQTASPELWFGASALPMFATHADEELGSSRLDLAQIKAEILEALRSAWVFENEEDTGDLEDIFAV
ncbi:MAG: hypothetical protein H6830_11545 [Planctomycetes bacterium]|nr:hypothetical protein [Planctomycetota bacterium]MCB9908698.1 hypothetical protein [Planctomycetota bacterium]